MLQIRASKENGFVRRRTALKMKGGLLTIRQSTSVPTYQNGKEDGRVRKDLEQVMSRKCVPIAPSARKMRGKNSAPKVMVLMLMKGVETRS